ncbi:VC0807 family protein [Cryptosporangium phraense]
MTQAKSTPAPGRRAMLVALGLDLVAPLVVFYGLRAAGVDQWWALLASAAVPAVVIAARFVRHRRLDFGALFALTLVGAGLVLSALSGNPRALLVRDAWLWVVGGVAGLWLIASCFYGRPGLFTLFRSFLVTRYGAERVAVFEARWDVEAKFRHDMRVITLVWGLALTLNAVVTVFIAYLAPIDVAGGAMNVVWPAIAVPLWIFHIAYTRKQGLRA